MEQHEDRPDGNYFGWKFSFFSLILMIITFFAIVFFDDPPEDGGNKWKNVETKQDSIRIERITGTKVTE